MCEVATQRRLGAENAKNRALLIDATEQILCEEGYAAVTARRVASKAGLKVQLVYYYFQTMDELILAFARKNTAKRLERFVQALVAPEPLRALWELNSDPASAILATELIALANHRETIRTEIVANGQQFRALQIDAVAGLLAAKGVNPEAYPPSAIVTIAAALARTMAQDCALGVTEGYAEAVGLVQRGLDFLYGGEAKKSP